MKRSLCFGIVVLLFLSSCSSNEREKNTLNISGAFALYPLMVKWSQDYQLEHPKVRFNISAGGAGKGMADALSGTVDLGMFSRELDSTEIEQGAWWIAVSKDAVIPTINAKNPVLSQLSQRGLTKNEFKKFYTGNTYTNWNQLSGITIDEAIRVYTRSDACGAAGTWASFLGGTQEDLKGIGVYGDPGLADAVIKDVKGLGYNNTVYLYNVRTGMKNSGIDVIPIDLNENGKIDDDERFYDSLSEVLDAIAKGKYPSPPARNLYLVAKGKPSKKLTLDFLKWIETSGQKYITKAGYVPLLPELVSQQLEKLND